MGIVAAFALVAAAVPTPSSVARATITVRILSSVSISSASWKGHADAQRRVIMKQEIGGQVIKLLLTEFE